MVRLFLLAICSVSRPKRIPQAPRIESVLLFADQTGYDDAQRMVAAAIAGDSTHIRKRIERRLAAVAVEHRSQPFDATSSNALHSKSAFEAFLRIEFWPDMLC